MSEKRIERFDISTKNLKIKNLISQEFLAVEFRAISNVLPNRNNSHFTREAIINAKDSCYNKPILAAYDAQKDSILAHEDAGIKYDSEMDQYYYDYTGKNCEVPIGIIPESAKVEIVEDPTDGLTWLVFSGLIWINYSYPVVKKILKSPHGKISVEVNVEEYHMVDDIEYIDKFTLIGCTCLGDQYTTGIPLARLTIPELEKTSVFKAQSQKISFALNKLKEQQEYSNSNDTKIEKPDNDNSISNEDQPRVSMEEPNKTDTPEDRTSRYSEISVPEMASTSVFQAQTKRLKFAYQELDKQNHSEQKVEKPDNDKPIPNENVDRISMDEPEDRTSRYSEISVADLTYEQKKSLIAQEFMRLEDDAEFWIEDIANTYVIIYYHSDDEHCNYKVGYIIDDDPNHTVHLDWDNKEKVIQTWKTFEKDNDSTNTNKIFDSKEDTPEMREVFKRDCEQSDIKADESPMDNNTPDSKAKFESKDIVENPGPEMGIVMAVDEKECNSSDPEKDKECNSSEEKECNSSDDCEKECNASDDSKEECAEDKCPDCGKPMSECNCKDANACEEPEKNCNSEEGCKESEACGDKEVEGCENKETEGCEDKEAESCDPEKKEEEGCKETEGCNPEDQCKNSCPEDECKMSDDPNGEHFSDDPHGEHFATVNVHGEDLNINQLLEKFTALEDSYNNLKEKYSTFEMKEFKDFALDTINKESRLLDETKANVRDEVMNAISCGKFSTKDEVEKFTVQSMAMALFNQKEVESTDNTEKESDGTKSDFEATIVKNPIGADENKVKKAKTGIDSLLEANNALKFV